MHEAGFYESLKENNAKCLICPHNCIVGEDKTGICRQRKNIKGKLYLLNYAESTSVNLDPIEKKPLYHFYPGTQIISFGTNGCNLKCMFCQNWSISHEDSPSKEILPEEVIKITKKQSSGGIAYTYNEPLIWYEFVRDCAKLARDEGIKNVLVTNGFINPEPFGELLPYIDAINIDIKSINNDFYKRLCKAKVEPVLETARLAKGNVLLEVTNLIIPKENDSEKDIRNLCQWVADNLGKATPIHFSAYYPAYQFDRPGTPLTTLQMAYDIAREYLMYVYLGNVKIAAAHTREGGEKGNDTFCAWCQTKLIERSGYSVKVLNLDKDGGCKRCGADNNIRSS